MLTGGPLVPGEEQHLAERDRAERDGRRTLERDRIAERLLAVDAEQHDHEQEQHDDRAGVHDDLHRGEQVSLLLDEEDRHAHQRRNERERGVHGIAGEYHSERAAERHRREDEEDHGGHDS